MNAYELANKLQEIYEQDLKANCWDDSIQCATTMLCQQADKIKNMEQWEKRHLDRIEQLEKEVEHYKNKADYFDKRELELLAEIRSLEKSNTELSFRAVYAERTLHVIERHYDQLETFSSSGNNEEDVGNTDGTLPKGKA